MVFPERFSTVVSERLLQLGIVPLYYSWKNEIPTFVKLDNILKEQTEYNKIWTVK
jgi:hypothetical protein